jgi:type IV secretory pathway VirB10-like protein
MDTTHIARFLLSRSPAPSRRGVLAALTSGLLAAAPFAPVADETEARKNGKRQRKRKKLDRRKKRKGGDNQQPTSPPPPPSPPSPPAPVARPDARCVGSSDVDFGAIENSRLAQTFTALSSGTLVRAELRVFKNDESTLDDWILRLSPVDETGEPSNRVLSQASVADASVPSGGSSVIFDFANPFSVVAGTTYALVLTRAEFFFWSKLNGNFCQGTAFHSSDQSGPFTETDGDFVYTTFVAS